MPAAAVRILHLEPDPGTGELGRLLARAREASARDLVERWTGLGAEDVALEGGTWDGGSFGARLRRVVAELGPDTGLVVLGSGSIPLASDETLAALLETARSGAPRALTNNRYSSDVVAVGEASILASLPDMPSDNALPRWLESQGITVAELPDRWRLALDLDSPLDLDLVRRHPGCPRTLVRLAASMSHRFDKVTPIVDELAALAKDRRAELLVAGRISASTLRSLERGTAGRIRALVEERGLRASWRLPGEQLGTRIEDVEDEFGAADRPWVRPPASALGMLLDARGPGEIGAIVMRLADGALVDSRVLLAHRLGADESAWPSAEDRYASDMLLADRVRDPWLRALTLAAWSPAIPIALGGHTLVGPGLPLALGIPAPDPGAATLPGQDAAWS